MIRNKDGEFEIGELQVQGLEEQEEGLDALEDESESLFLKLMEEVG